MTIVRATTADLQTIQSLTYKIWPLAYGNILSEAQLTYMLQKFYSLGALRQSMLEQQQYVLAMQNERAVGFMGFENRYKGTLQTKIHRLYVLPQTQGEGIGKSMLEFAQREAILAGDIILTLNVNRYNNALNFYQHLGFIIADQEDIDIGNGYLMEDFIMQKAL